MSAVTGPREKDLPSWLWLWFPPLLVVAVYGAKAVDDAIYQRWFPREDGIVEIGTLVVLLPAIVIGARLLLRRRQLPFKLLVPWVALVALGAFFFLGEEASWGQHALGWGTPEALAKVNKQGETNLHNIAPLLDKLPRVLLSAAAVVAIAIPFVRRLLSPLNDRARIWHWILPTYVCLPTALLAMTVTVPRHLNTWITGDKHGLPVWLDTNPGEIKEYYLGLFMSLYMWSLWVRTRASRGADAGARPTAA